MTRDGNRPDPSVRAVPGGKERPFVRGAKNPSLATGAGGADGHGRYRWCGFRPTTHAGGACGSYSTSITTRDAVPWLAATGNFIRSCYTLCRLPLVLSRFGVELPAQAVSIGRR